MCSKIFDADNDYTREYDSILDSAKDFRRLSRASIMKFGEGINPFHATLGRIIIADLWAPGWEGEGILVKGRVVEVGRQTLKVDVNGEIKTISQQFAASTGAGKLSDLAVVVEKSRDRSR